jgi:hypothetical protein
MMIGGLAWIYLASRRGGLLRADIAEQPAAASA